ncbi:hypothetical protein MD484_g8852, partial [Candolleomyces efflorescens]
MPRSRSRRGRFVPRTPSLGPSEPDDYAPSTPVVADVSLNDVCAMLASMNMSMTLSPTPVREVWEYEDVNSAGRRSVTISGTRTNPSTPSRRSAVAEPVITAPPRTPPDAEWVTPDSDKVNLALYYVVARGRCCGIFTDWGFVSPPVSGVPADVRFHFKRYTYAEALQRYEELKEEGEVRLVGRTARDVTRYGPPHLCIM